MSKKASVPSVQYEGLLVIGDPHLEGRQPDFRKDVFPETVLGKVEWCLDYADENNLLAAFLGDMFQNPRDNPTWMLTRLIGMMKDRHAIGIFGNHDCAETTLNDHDSLSILIQAGCLQLVDYQNPWRGEMNGRTVRVGGSSYRFPIPESVAIEKPKSKTLFADDPLVVWLTHHDVEVPGYDGGHVKPFEIENVDLLINGHIHKRSEPIQCGQTLWLNPGNITRRSRSDRSRSHVPRVLQINVFPDDYELVDVTVPHKDFEEVFHESEIKKSDAPVASGFVTGLKELVSRKTQTGAGLHQFLDENLEQFETDVAAEIRNLANAITKTELTNA